MKRANPADLRKAINVANTFVKSGILFVPVPVGNDDEGHAKLVAQADRALNRLILEGEKP